MDTNRQPKQAIPYTQMCLQHVQRMDTYSLPNEAQKYKPNWL